MTVTAGIYEMAKKKKSETRRHSAVLRLTPTTLEQVKLAASLMKITLADYADAILLKQAEKDIEREANKLTKRSKE
jgi:hypothetical protein